MNSYKSIIFILSICLCNIYGISQDSNFVIKKVISNKTVSFSVNNIGELFLVNKENQLKKLDSKGDSAGVFNEISKYGKLSYVESRNPWRTILFYKDFNYILLLDKYLNEVTNINLRKNNLFRISAVTSSYDNNIWVFDGQNERIKKMDENGKILSESIDFRLLFENAPLPDQLKDRDGFLYLYDAKKGLYVFDYYGSFKNKFNFLNWKDFEVIGKNIYGFDEQYLYRYQLNSVNIDKFLLPRNVLPYTSVKVANNKIYFLHNESLNIYDILK